MKWPTRVGVVTRLVVGWNGAENHDRLADGWLRWFLVLDRVRGI